MAWARIALAIERQSPNLALWVPVLFAAGILVYFALPFEPEPWMLAALCGLAGLCSLTLLRVGFLGRVALMLVLIPAAGFLTGAVRTMIVAAPVLTNERSLVVEGRIIGLSRSNSNLPQVLLDRLVIYGLDPAETPQTVRISLGALPDPSILSPGRRITGTARLSPPAGPSEPGGFDFRQVAWFARLGAVGYARTPMLEVEGSDVSWLHQVAFRARMALSAHIQSLVPGQPGAFSAAILTGDRSNIDQQTNDDLRRSTLYHLVSISGLHMSLIAAAVFAMVRYGLAVVPWFALHWPLKKIAAVVALIGAGAYLVISGLDVAAQRSYIMTAVVLCAILLDRPALTLRSVALAAMVVLLFAPESLMQAGFQMSFAATIALVAGFDALRGMAWWRVTQTDRRWRFVKPVLAVAMTSLVAGTATAPFSAFHFNTVAKYGLFANLLGVPAMGIVVMPAAVVGLVAAPFGLDWLPFTVMGWGNAYVLAVARFIAGLGGAATGVHSGPDISLVLIALGGLVLVLWCGPGRWAGLAPIAAGFLLWVAATRPEVLIAENGRLFGVMTAQGRALSTDRGGGYAAASWLENDGDTASQAEAAMRGRFQRGRGRIEGTVPGLGPIVYNGSKDPAAGDRECTEAAILIAPKWSEKPRGRCLFINAETLRREGALAIRVQDGAMRVEGALARDGRPWTRPAEPAPRALDPQQDEAGAKTADAG